MSDTSMTPGAALLEAGDIEIGAVELKDAAADVRAKVAALNTLLGTDIGLAAAAFLGPAIVPAATTMQNAAVANGNGTSLNTQGYAVAILNIVSSPAMSGGTTINFEASVDDTTWVSILAHQTGVAGSQAITATADGDFRVPCAGYKSIRARISAYSAGTVTVKGYVGVLPSQPTVVGVSGGNVASGVADSGNPVKVGGVYNTTLPTLTNGQRGDVQLNAKGQLEVAFSYSTGISDGQAGPGGLLDTGGTVRGFASQALLFSGSNWDRQRTPNTFKTALATASGDTAVWTPTSGKKFRLIRYGIYITGQATQAAPGSIEVLLRDATTATGLGWSVFVPAIAITDQFGYFSGWINIDNGFLSAAANNVLNVNLSAALATGEIRIVAIGTEE